jgi:hypothetical protein
MLAGALALALLGGGCGGGTRESGSTPSQTSTTGARAEALVGLVAEKLLAEAAADPNELQLTPQQAQSIADGAVVDLSPDRLAALGFDPDSGSLPGQKLASLLTADERETVATHLETCVDLVSAVTAMLTAAGLDDVQGACVADMYVQSGLLHESLVAAGYDPDLNQRIDDFMTAAVTSRTG